MSMLEQRAIRARMMSPLIANINIPMCLGFLVNLGTISLITLGGGGSQLALTVLVICINAMSIIALKSGIDGLSAFAKDQDEDISQTHGGQRLKEMPFGLYKVITTAIFGSLAISQLYMMHWA